MDYFGLDIDWFFIDNEKKICFAASGGGEIPHSIKKEVSYEISNYFRSLPILQSDFSMSELLPLTKKISDHILLEKMHYDFIQMAKRGIYSFDRTILNDYDDSNYHLVAKPRGEILDINSLPDSILYKISKTLFKGNVDEISSFNLNHFEHID